MDMKVIHTTLPLTQNAFMQITYRPSDQCKKASPVVVLQPHGDEKP